MKRFICILLTFISTFSLISCSDTEGTETSSEPEPVTYTIVHLPTFTDEAQAIADAVRKASGLEFPIVKYTNGYTLPENSIIVGKINDGVAETLTAGMNRRDFVIKTVGSSLYICSDGKDALQSAVEYFIKNLITSRGVKMDSDYNYIYDYLYPLEGATINGISISKFNIVYASTENEAKYGDVAELFKKHLDQNADAVVSCYSEDKAKTENEIVLGIATDRQQVSGYKESDFEYNTYKIIISGTKVAVVGNNASAVYQGCMALMDYIASSDNKNAKDTEIDGSHDLIKVACVGDSITKGANSTYPNTQNYPAYLQQMLGYDYYVKNFGIDGYSLINTDFYAYNKTAEYTASKSFKPDVVLFILGTNDCNPGQDYKDWTNPERKVKYKESAKQFFDSYYALNKNVQIFMGVPSTLFYSTVWPWEEWAARIVANAVPLNREIADENDLPVIDMYTWSLENQSVFTDGLHPHDETYKRYAKRVYDEIKDVIKKPQ